jgi:pimeloyl-ACP methyl ester carboxylesterase
VAFPVPDRASFVDVNRTRLRLWEWGDASAPAVVCVHGAYDHGRMFDGLAPRIAELGCRVIAPDLRGHGDSGPVSSGNTWLAMNLDLALLARQLEPPVGLIGHSFGGGQCLCVAGAFPELARWVVSIDGLGPPRDQLEGGDAVAAATQGFEALERLWTSSPRHYPSVEDLAERRRRINVRLSEEWALHLATHGSRPTDDGRVEWKFDRTFSVGLGGPFTRDLLLEEYRLVQCPVLVLTGTEPDTWRDPDLVERDARVACFADGRLEVVDGVGHYVHLEDPDATVAAIAAFVAENGG